MDEHTAEESSSGRDQLRRTEKTVLPEELKEDIWLWIRKRLRVGALVFAVVTFFGGKSLVEWTVQKCADREFDRARQATYEADMAARMAREKAGQAIDAIENVKAVAGNTRAQLQILQQEIEREGTSVKGLLARDVDLLRTKLGELERLVGQIAEAKGLADENLAVYKEKIAGVEEEARQRDARSVDNTKYVVNIYCRNETRDLAECVFKELASQAFKVAPPVDIIEAQRSLSVIQTQALLVYTKPLKDLRELSENLLTYTPAVAKEKVEEVRTVVSTAAGLQKPSVYTREFFARDYSQPFSVQVSSTHLDEKPVIEIYLVNRK